MSTPSYWLSPMMLWRRLVKRADRFTEEARRCLLEAAQWWMDRLHASGLEIAIDERDIEILTPRSIRRLERAVPELAFPRRPLAVVAARRGWIHVGGSTIHGLGAPVPPRTVDNFRHGLETAPTEPMIFQR